MNICLENLIYDTEKNQVTSKHERSDHSNGDAIEVNHEYVLSSSHELNDAHRSITSSGLNYAFRYTSNLII